ncbi:uncharacterized protein LOC117115131 isoform X2 [Anneissia japonica]|nr:uncharacterized protein LOC117115131 isoform X2 [Anneissia japonica]XP_033114714.1 uncharacterized protein LOC117115131 isoform X2 [Anneissia japonica]
MESENKILEEDGELQTSADEVSEDLTEKLTIADAPQQEICEEVSCEEDICEKEMSSNSRPSTPEVLQEKQKESQPDLETDEATFLPSSEDEVEKVEESNAAENEIKPLEDGIKPLENENDAKPLENDITPLKNDVKPLEHDAKPLENDITPLENDVKPLENDITPLENDVKPLENDTKPLENYIKPLENDVKPIENDIKPVENDKDKVDVEPTAAQATITNSSAKRRKAKGKMNAKQTAQTKHTASGSQMAYCYICNQSLNSASQAISHFQGRKHIRMQERRLGAIDSQIYKVTDQAIKPAATEEQPKETLLPADRKFYCSVCRKYLNSAHQYTMHIESDKHRKKELKNGEQAHGRHINDTQVSGKQVTQKKEAREANRHQRNQARFYQMKREEQISPRTWPTPADMDFHRYNQWLQCQEPMMPRGRGRVLTQHRRGTHRGRGWHGSIYNGNHYISNNNGSYSHFTGRRYRMPTDVALRGGGSNGRQSSMMHQPSRFYSQLREDKHQGPKPSHINYPLSEFGQSRGYSI